MVDLQLLALEADLDARLSRLREMARKAGTNVDSGTSKDVPDPVLVALGEKGRARLMWEYHKTYVSKRPAYGKAARMSYKPGSYVGQLYVILSHHLGAQSSKHLSSASTLRDFLADWCLFFSHCRPPFVPVGPRANLSVEDWESLPMHEMEGADMQRLPDMAPGHAENDSEDEIDESAAQQTCDEHPAGLTELQIETERDFLRTLRFHQKNCESPTDEGGKRVCDGIY